MKTSAAHRMLLLVALGLHCLSPSARAGESAEAIFPGTGVTEVVVSPGGDWIAARVHRDKDAMVAVQRVGSPELVVVARSEWIGFVAWEASNTLVIESIPAAGMRQVLVVRLSVAAGKIDVNLRKIGTRGSLVDSLPLIPEKVLWVFPGMGSTSIHRISFAELIDYNRLYQAVGGQIEIAEKLATVKGSSSHWIAQRDGTPRAALRYTEDEVVLMMPSRVTGSFSSVYRFGVDEKEREVYPVGLTSDERRLLVLAYKDGDTFGLYEWDEDESAVGDPVFVHKEYDLSNVLTDRLTGDLVAAIYEENGEQRYHYFKEYRARFLSKLPEEWQKDSISIRSGTADRQVFAFFDSSATNPGDYYIRDRATRVHRIGRFGENIDRDALSPVTSFRAKSKDGVEIEAFLAIPKRSAGRAPLVVIPHGGPRAVRDSRQYDPMAQYLASWGFAVLQVNYRGSSGYGLEFEKLGKKQWARGIEDDIDAAVEHAMGLPEIDGERICIVGGSYGGFSAFASVIRHKERYRCAVSINGASDIPLLYDSSDMADSKQAMEIYEAYVGDLETERDELIKISPAYHVRELSTPTLVIFGSDDRRVDPDHSHRMVMMFELYGKQHETLEIEGMEHGYERDEGIIVYRAVRRFLTAYLMPESPYRPDP